MQPFVFHFPTKIVFGSGKLAETGQEAKKLQKVTAPVLHMMSSSGLLREEILQWLAALRDPPDESALENLIEMELMQNELSWQLGNVQRTLRDFLDKQNGRMKPDDAQRYQNISDDLSKCLEKK